MQPEHDGVDVWTLTGGWVVGREREGGTFVSFTATHFHTSAWASRKRKRGETALGRSAYGLVKRQDSGGGGDSRCNHPTGTQGADGGRWDLCIVRSTEQGEAIMSREWWGDWTPVCLLAYRPVSWPLLLGRLAGALRSTQNRCWAAGSAVQE